MFLNIYISYLVSFSQCSNWGHIFRHLYGNTSLEIRLTIDSLLEDILTSHTTSSIAMNPLLRLIETNAMLHMTISMTKIMTVMKDKNSFRQNKIINEVSFQYILDIPSDNTNILISNSGHMNELPNATTIDDIRIILLLCRVGSCGDVAEPFVPPPLSGGYHDNDDAVFLACGRAIFAVFFSLISTHLSSLPINVCKDKIRKISYLQELINYILLSSISVSFQSVEPESRIDHAYFNLDERLKQQKEDFNRNHCWLVAARTVSLLSCLFYGVAYSSTIVPVLQEWYNMSQEMLHSSGCDNDNEIDMNGSNNSIGHHANDNDNDFNDMIIRSKDGLVNSNYNMHVSSSQESNQRVDEINGISDMISYEQLGSSSDVKASTSGLDYIERLYSNIISESILLIFDVEGSSRQPLLSIILRSITIIFNEKIMMKYDQSVKQVTSSGHENKSNIYICQIIILLLSKSLCQKYKDTVCMIQTPFEMIMSPLLLLPVESLQILLSRDLLLPIYISIPSLFDSFYLSIKKLLLNEKNSIRKKYYIELIITIFSLLPIDQQSTQLSILELIIQMMEFHIEYRSILYLKLISILAIENENIGNISRHILLLLNEQILIRLSRICRANLSFDSTYGSPCRIDPRNVIVTYESDHGTKLCLEEEIFGLISLAWMLNNRLNNETSKCTVLSIAKYVMSEEHVNVDVHVDTNEEDEYYSVATNG